MHRPVMSRHGTSSFRRNFTTLAPAHQVGLDRIDTVDRPQFAPEMSSRCRPSSLTLSSSRRLQYAHTESGLSGWCAANGGATASSQAL
jgi:hypothetical protein